MSSKQLKWLLATIILLAVLLRIVGLTKQSLWNDELHSMNGADPKTTILEVIAYSKIDQPPAYFTILHYWFKIVPYNEYYGRLLSVLFGIAGVLSMFFLGREIKDQRVGLLCSFLTAINYFHIYYSQEVRFYSLLFALSAISYIFFLRSLKGNNWIDLSGYIISTSLVVYTHYFGIVLVLSQFLIAFALVLFARVQIKPIVSLAVSYLIIFLIALPWIPNMVKDNSASSFWIQPVKAYFPFSFFYGYFRDPIVSILFCVVLGRFLFVNRQELIGDVSVIVLLASIILGFAIPLTYSFLKMPMLISRYTMIILPSLIALISMSLFDIKTSYFRILIITIFVSSLATLIFFNRFYSRIRNEQFREASEALLKNNLTKSVVFSDHGWQFNYYLRAAGSNQLAFNPWSVDYPRILQQHYSVYVLSISGTIWPPLLKELEDQGYRIEKTESFFNSELRHYVKNGHLLSRDY